MIFSISDHIEQIKAGTKTQTRRPTARYQESTLYVVQPGRGIKGIPDGRIFIGEKWREHKIHTDLPLNSFARRWMELEAGCPISKLNAKAEGGYTPNEYELLYEKMYPGWQERWAYRFSFFTVDQLIEWGVRIDE